MQSFVGVLFRGEVKSTASTQTDVGSSGILAVPMISKSNLEAFKSLS